MELFLGSPPQTFAESKMGTEKLWKKEEGNEGPRTELKSTGKRESQSMWGNTEKRVLLILSTGCKKDAYLKVREAYKEAIGRATFVKRRVKRTEAAHFGNFMAKRKRARGGNLWSCKVK